MKQQLSAENGFGRKDHTLDPPHITGEGPECERGEVQRLLVPCGFVAIIGHFYKDINTSAHAKILIREAPRL